MNTLAAIEPFTVVTTCIYAGLAIFGLVMIRIASKPLKRKEQERDVDEAYKAGFRRGLRQGLETPYSRQFANDLKPINKPGNQ